MDAGPARGWWQFERNGGVAGVLSITAARRPPSFGVIHARSSRSSIPSGERSRVTTGSPLASLGCCSGQIPLHSLAIRPTPGTCYADRLWRPGKPHPRHWGDNWLIAGATIPATRTVARMSKHPMKTPTTCRPARQWRNDGPMRSAQWPPSRTTDTRDADPLPSRPDARQCMLIAARRFDPCPDLSPVTFYGSFADWAKEIIARLNRQLTEQPQETRH